MKSFYFDKNNLSNLYGLSCIENFLLYILKTEKYQYKYLFYKSFLSFSEIVDAFSKDKVEYAYFNKVKRIQDLAKEDGIISIFTHSILELSFLDEHDYICIMVNPNFIKLKYKTDLWRDDHFILLLKANNNNFHYLNDTPRDIGIISFDELKNIFAGQIIAFDIRKNINDESKERFLAEFIANLKINQKDITVNITDFIMARDILGIHRILRKRVYDFCSQYINVEFLIPYLNVLDKQYSFLEYMRLRNKMDFNKINDILNFINQEDINEMIKLKRNWRKQNELSG